MAPCDYNWNYYTKTKVNKNPPSFPKFKVQKQSSPK